MTTSPALSPLEEARLALIKPLAFVCRGGLLHLRRVHGVEASVRALAERLLALARDNDAVARQVQAILRSLPDGEAPELVRLAKLKGCLELAEKLELAAAPITPRVSIGPGLDCDVQFIKGVGPHLAELLRRRGLRTLRELLYFLPRRYEDRRAALALGALGPDMAATVEAEVLSKTVRAMRGRRSLEVLLGDGADILRLRWFRVPGRAFVDRFVEGARVRVAGAVREYRGQLEMVHPELLPLGGVIDDVLVPVYSELERMPATQMRRIMAAAIELAGELEDLLPEYLRARHGLADLTSALRCLHRPPAGTDPELLRRAASPWHRRLIYEELLLLQLGVLRRKALVQLDRGSPLVIPSSLGEELSRLFDFAPTRAQAQVLSEIESDLRRDVPMQRLLQGDVGSGKTAVAFAAAAAVVKAGMQVAIMAPTELLAEQHARVARRSLERAGVRVELLTGGASAAERRRILAAIAGGQAEVIVGTHALIQPDVSFKALGLVIIDEQHRFGVMQRAALSAKGKASCGAVPHTLVMTATPIPRTLALTFYGDLDLSIIDELPPGRTPIETMIFPGAKRELAYARVLEAVRRGRQAYVVYPLVDESESEGMEGVQDATRAARELVAGPFLGLRVGLLHGRMASFEKDEIMRAFAGAALDVLVATTVIEVGIDVANATVMVIEHAERFGLSQLHQLRGRVGRGAHASECLLIAHGGGSLEARQRLKVMRESGDGFRIAEEDLRLRGPGDFVGTRQSGLPLLSVADLARDQALLLRARDDAREIIASDPELSDPRHAGLKLLWSDFHERGLVLA